MSDQFAFLLDSPKFGQIVVLRDYDPQEDKYVVAVIWNMNGLQLDMKVAIDDKESRDDVFEKCRHLDFVESTIRRILKQ